MNSEMPEIGKISLAIFEELILPGLGAKSDKALIGPQHVDVDIARSEI